MIHPASFASLVVAGSLALVAPVLAQDLARSRSGRAADSPSSRSVAFEGFVLAEDGTPVAGAEVASSAGGCAVTALDGRYRLEVEVPLEAENVEITATAGDLGASLSIRTSLDLVSAPLVTPVDPLALVPGPSCHPRWLPAAGHTPRLEDWTRTLGVFDDGSGPALYVGLQRTSSRSEPNYIAKWDGRNWTPLGSGLTGPAPRVGAMAVYDDGSGPAFYVGGNFTDAGGVTVNNIGRWDGSSWASLGAGLGSLGTNTYVDALEVFDDGNGPKLYVGGSFTSADGVSMTHIASWDGSSWSPLGSGMNGAVTSLAVFDDGSGAALYACGGFSSAGGVAAQHVARWDGTSWEPLGSGLQSPTNGYVFAGALAVFDDGSGPALYLGGDYEMAGGTTANGIAKWDGSTWSAMGGMQPQSPNHSTVHDLEVLDDGSGAALYVAGAFSGAGGVAVNHVARWDGTSWSALGDGPACQFVSSLVVFDGALHAGCNRWDPQPGMPQVWNEHYVAKWDGASWSGVNTALAHDVRALTTFDLGNGPALYVGGDFNDLDSNHRNLIASWDGTSWGALGGGLAPGQWFLGSVHALAGFDDGTGPALYAGGSFGIAGSMSTSNIAKWDGTSWSALGAGTNGWVHALCVFDDGTYPALYVGGHFSTAGGLSANRIARWDGTNWSTLGTGLNGRVHALAVFDDGTGPGLYVGGNFTIAGGVPANYIARWDGSSWSPLGDGMHGVVNALAVFDDGSGPVLVSGSNGEPHYIAKWDGTSWSPMSGGVGGPVMSLAAFDDGTGPAVYAGGFFTSAGSVAANRIAKWNGTSWSPLHGGMSAPVLAMAVFDGGEGASLYSGGNFIEAFDSGDSYLARWGCPSVRHKVRRR